MPPTGRAGNPGPNARLDDQGEIVGPQGRVYRNADGSPMMAQDDGNGHMVGPKGRIFPGASPDQFNPAPPDDGGSDDTGQAIISALLSAFGG